MMLVGCIGTEEEEKIEVSIPSFSELSKNHDEPFYLAIDSEMDGVEIYYTKDGSAPDKNSTKYDGEFRIDGTMTIKAVVYKGDVKSNVFGMTYVILI